MMRKKLLGALALACMMGTLQAQEKVIVMGYKDESKLPLIGDAKDNSGAYEELYSKAAAAIGHTLKTVRYPKKRLFQMIENGEIDFYPGASYSDDRAQYMCFIDNGFETSEVLLSKKQDEEITDCSKITGTLVVDLGGSKENFDQQYKNVKINKVSGLTIDRAIKMIQAGRADFFIADIEEVDYYKKTNNIKSLDDIGIKVHSKALGGTMPMYLGFSMKSKLFKGKDNPNYKKDAPMSFENTPKTASDDCVAFQFGKALKDLKAAGQTKIVYEKFFVK